MEKVRATSRARQVRRVKTAPQFRAPSTAEYSGRKARSAKHGNRASANERASDVRAEGQGRTPATPAAKGPNTSAVREKDGADARGGESDQGLGNAE